MKVLLCGNPNTGKTTLFNTMAKAKEKASNWHGVTVDVKQKSFKIEDKEFMLCDLPGIYSLEGISKEEELSAEFIKENINEIVVCVLDANNLKRNLLLAVELKNICKNLILAVNMANEVKCFDAEKLSEFIGLKVIPIDARKKKSVDKLKQAILKMSEEVNEQDNSSLNKALSFINSGLDNFEEKVKDKFGFIDDILKKSGYDKIGAYGQSKLDKILLNAFWSPIIFILVMGLVFFITFGPVGTFFSSMFSSFMQSVTDSIVDLLSRAIKSEGVMWFIKEGAIDGVLAVLGFLPQIILMSMCLNILEDFGYLSRVAFMFDGFLKRFGLTGKAVFSLIMGFGCTTSAIITTRNLNGKKLRERTVMLLPFMSCSAKLPIYAVICSAFFVKYKAVIVFGLYLFAILLMLFVAFVMKLVSKKQDEEVFILEMPKFRVPTIKKVFSDAISSAKSFVLKVGGAILISSMVIFLLYNFKFNLQVTSNHNESIINVLSSKLEFLFVPLGFGMAGAVVSIVSGLVAKEMVVSSLCLVNACTLSELGLSLTNSSSAVHFTFASAISFLVFILLYSPCISSLMCTKKEISTKHMLKSFFLQFLIAYFVSMVVYLIGHLFEMGLWWISVLLLIFLAVIIFVVLKLIKKKNIKVDTKLVCTSCKGEKCGDYCL